MDTVRVLSLFRELQASGFADVAGARASATIPISDRLISRLLLESIPPTAPVREVDLRALGANRFSVRVRLSRPALLPPITIQLEIVGQPSLPDIPVIVVRLVSSGLLSFAGMAARFFDVLPPGVRMDGDHIVVNLRTLLEQQGLAEYLEYVEQLEITAETGRFVVFVRGAIAGPR